MGLHMREELVVDALRGAAQRELPQGREIAGREEMLQGALGLMGQVDLALPQALQEVVGRDVDDLDVVGLIEDRVRHRLAHPDARDLGHHVVEALDVLDVQGRVDVDAGRQHLLDVLVALRVAAARGVGMGEFVDEGDLRVTRDESVEIHLLEPAALVVDLAAGQDVETLDEGLRFAAAVRLDHGRRDVEALAHPGPRRREHLEGLADAGGRAEEDLQPSPLASLPSRRGQQGIRRGTLVAVVSVVGHLHLPPVEASGRLPALASAITSAAVCRAPGSAQAR